MNKLFRKMLALLAVAVLVGQTMFTSVVTAEEADSTDWKNIATIDDSNVSLEDSKVVNLSTENLDEVKELSTEPLNIEAINLKTDSSLNLTDENKIETNSNTAGSDNWENKEWKESSLSTEKLNEFSEELQKSLPDWYYARVVEWELYLYVSNSHVHDLSIVDVTDLIDVLLAEDPKDTDKMNLWIFWKSMLKSGIHPTISVVTAMIDMILNDEQELNVGAVITISTREGNFVLRIVWWKPSDICEWEKGGRLTEIADIINEYIDDRSKANALAKNGEIVIYYSNNYNIIKYVTALIDYILTDWKNNDNSNMMSLWKAIGEDYVLNISHVTALIDLALNWEKTKMDMKNWSCDYGEVVVRLEELVPSSDWTYDAFCKDLGVDEGNFEVFVRNLNGNFESKWIKASYSWATLYLSVNKDSAVRFSIGTLSSLIDYLLTKKVDNERWYIWSAMTDNNAKFEPSMDTLTDLIDLLLTTGWSLKPWQSAAVRVEWWCFNLAVIADNSNWNNPGNGSSWWWSSSRWTNVSNDVLEEFRWEVDEPEKAESCSIEGSTFSDEENQAYLWACEKWIVLADNIMKANFNKPITRAELDKMMSIYAKYLLWRSYIVNENVSYPDVDSSLWDLASYIQEWYKLQIMGIHANGVALNNFLPNSLVTRWEFGTVFSRVLYGNKYNVDGANYYEKHLQVLKDAGILTNTNHSLTELRGWVVLMLYRSQKVEKSNWAISNEEIASIS